VLDRGTAEHFLGWVSSPLGCISILTNVSYKRSKIFFVTRKFICWFVLEFTNAEKHNLCAIRRLRGR
jgi:hypothetical protein